MNNSAFQSYVKNISKIYWNTEVFIKACSDRQNKEGSTFEKHSESRPDVAIKGLFPYEIFISFFVFCFLRRPYPMCFSKQILHK